MYLGKLQLSLKNNAFKNYNGIRNAQFELDTIYYHQVYKAPIKPWTTELDDDGNRTTRPSINIDFALGYNSHILFPRLFGTYTH